MKELLAVNDSKQTLSTSIDKFLFDSIDTAAKANIYLIILE